MNAWVDDRRGALDVWARCHAHPPRSRRRHHLEVVVGAIAGLRTRCVTDDLRLRPTASSVSTRSQEQTVRVPRTGTFRVGHVRLAAIIDGDDQLRAAAQLRAATAVKTPDALQLVAAIGAGCKTFVTNDRRLPSVSGLRVVELAAYVK